MQEWQEKIEQQVGQLQEEVKQLKEQRTEEMKAIHVNVASADVLNQLKALEQGQQELRQELHTISETWLDTLQEHYNEHTARFDKIESTMATKEDLSAMKEEIIDAIRRYSQPGGNGH